MRLPYPALCLALGLVIGWIPMFFHGPIPYKFDVFGIDGALAVWAWYVARMSIGLLVGLSSTPRRWWLRGPLCGLLAMTPLGIVSTATPGCGVMCMFWNDVTGTIAGGLIAGIAYALTGRHHALDDRP